MLKIIKLLNQVIYKKLNFNIKCFNIYMKFVKTGLEVGEHTSNK